MKRRVLLIEDDRWLADSYCQALTAYTVDRATSAWQAIERIDAQRYDVIVADVMLESGVVTDLLHELQAYDDTAPLPIILCTALAGRITLDDVRAYGVVAVLDKTMLTPKLLREAVEGGLALRSVGP